MLQKRLVAVTIVVLAMLALIPLAVYAGPLADDKVAPAPASAETVGPNLLANPGLEGHYHQQCSYKTNPPWVPAPFYCDPSNYDYANITLWATAQVPDGWAAWWRVPNDNFDDPNYYNTYPHTCQGKPRQPADCKPWHNPEFRDTAGGPQETGPSRRIEGENSQKYFTFYTVHEAGLYQIVNSGFKPGDKLRFSIWMEAWSSPNNDPFKSEGQPTMGMKVGIDPWGGNDPWSPNIIWSNVQESFDHFSQFTVEAVAKNTMVSVWTRSQPYFAIQHNDVYVDAGSLNVVQSAPAPRPAVSRSVTRTVTVTSTVVTTKTVSGQVVTSTAIVTSTKVVTVPAPATSTKPTTSTVSSSVNVSGTQSIPASGTYTVVRGDTLIAIARRFGITPWWRLGEMNNIAPPYKIEVGQVLKLK